MNKTQYFWDKQAKKYDYSERQFEPVFKKVITKTKTYLNANDLVLDYGCATGTKTLQLAESIKHIHGIDISSGMISYAIKKKDEAGINNVDFLQGTIFINEFKDASFDKIVAYGIIHLLDDKEKVFERIQGLLKPNGLFISTTACLKDKMAIKNRLEFTAYLFIKKIGIFPLHLNILSAIDVEKMIQSYNFKIVEAETIFDGITVSFIIAKKI